MFTDIAICQAVLDALTEATVLKDDQRKLVFLNQKACELFGRRREDLIGRDVSFFTEENQSARQRERDIEVLTSGIKNVSEEMLIDANGKIRNVLVRKSRVTLESRHYILTSIMDISLQRSSEAQIRYLARHDVLTGLPNRTALNEDLSQIAAQRMYRPEPYALFLLNLNEFNYINDTYGYQAGDAILCEFGQRLRNEIGSSGTVSRIGGDEFAIILRNSPTQEQANNLALEILVMMRQPFSLTRANPMVTLSLGIVMFGAENITAGEIMRRGNTALLEAKQRGKNMFSFYSELLDASSVSKRIMVKALAESLSRQGDLTCVYQPILRSSDEKVVCVEALARWNHGVLGAVSPVQFIALAEETGLVIQLGEIILRQACQDILGLEELNLAINVSAVQLGESNFADRILALLEEEGFPANRLELELTETSVMNANCTSLTHLVELRKAGVKISLDDFGTGYSSLSLLKDISVDSVKIDRSFVQYVTEVNDTAAIVSAVSQLGNKMKLNVIAEGVENQLQKTFLISAGCSHLQGYLFSRPVPIEVLRTLLDSSLNMQNEA
ncbi:MAG: EAL domain-containing protein [Ewingella americana]|jgi:diguanylate cyclase (GGDEF)-like protein/PAS domain S-box-containing protein|uniref:sensor domain-containing protein n=1 Tax=Ewingella americana TaxID=41202 RepID=UPI00242C47DE|nr:EAL domain-containing protein [Ewingella americana]MCI1679103.1 EAL domain-containing protein [Ewingella americana]MCI1852253.1 EAL domain-containing protein [Ewingella americana]MCI1862655.1 EAL domain-containing protein [Ewingella americana]MCI2142915.1 EAL domain-containing protein [Ewingella americana]MCI2163407.1 EAL domain-containing protein [Ewingella americana]